MLYVLHVQQRCTCSRRLSKGLILILAVIGSPVSISRAGVANGLPDNSKPDDCI